MMSGVTLSKTKVLRLSPLTSPFPEALREARGMIENYFPAFKECRRENQTMIGTATARGLHEYVAAHVLARYARAGTRAVDLGAGPGAMCERLHLFGCEVVAVDRDPALYQGQHRFVAQDLNHAAFASEVGTASFDLVVAVEVIEHVESPINFLRNIAQLLAPGGVAVVTTPNVDSLPARLSFLLEGKIRMMDEVSDPTHISPIFSDLLRRQFLPRAGLKLSEHLLFPPKGYQLTRKPFALPLALAASVFPGDSVLGDNHIFVFKAAT
jgi:2-polyprenyl-3-methyl-5-hydroxy-6-metoxy-1,4-benzoquinol methylase